MKILKKGLTLILILFILHPLAFSQQDDENSGKNNDTIYSYAEQMPEYPGGSKAIIKHIAENLIYPEEARNNGIQGRVFLRFEVTKTGKIGKVEIVKKVHPILDNEAVRVIKTLDDFKPGMKDGNPVNVWVSIPVTFRIPVSSDINNTTMPVFKGENGIPLMKYISFLLRDVEEHRGPDVYGTVDLNVEITKKGKVAKIEKLKGIEAGFDKQVIQKIKLLPDFIPATQNGKPIKCFLEIPITFPKKTDYAEIKVQSFSIDDLISNNNNNPKFKNLSLFIDEYISKNIYYPHDALYAGLNGSVTVKFILTKDSEVKEINLINSSNPIFEDEAIRLIKNLPELKPKLIHKKPATVKIHVRVDFNCDTFDITKPEYSEGKEELTKRYSDSIKKYINEKEIPDKYFLFLEINKEGKIAKQKIIYGKKDKKNNKIDSIVNKITATLPDFIPGKINGKPADTWYVITISGEPIFIYVKNMPKFPGGVTALNNYIAEHVVYPEEARNKGIEGTIFIRYEVTKTGSIGKVEIQKGVHPLLDNAAIMVIKSLPDFIPGEQNGKKVNVWYSIPVDFRLN